MRKVGTLVSSLAFVLLLAGPGLAQAAEKENGKGKGLDPAGVERLREKTGGKARVSISPATGAARFVNLEAGFRGDLMSDVSGSARQKARAFIHDYAGMLGLRDADAEINLVGERTDKLGDRHLTFDQYYRGVPVFAGLVRAHVSSDGRLVAVNGNVIPGIRVNPNPTRSASDAAATAIALVSGDNEGREVYARSGVLTVYRTGLVRGVDGESLLTWQIEVGNGSDIREFLFVDAHSGKVVDRLPGIMDDRNRRAYDAQGQTAPGPNYPATPYWVEGNPFPTASGEANNMITSSGETYGFFDDAFGRDSFDDGGAIMDSIFNRGNGCPNASWNGLFISFCPGTTTDDVTAHEWGHAYTQYTHNLIYQWQPGALNESYSDIWGETIDRINGRDDPGFGDSANDPLRTTGSCSTYTVLPPVVTINSPAAIAGNKAAGTAAFGPQSFAVTNDLVLVNDGVGATIDGCETPFTNAAAIVGKIAFMDRGVCGFAVKVKNAQLNGAVAAIIGNNQGGTAVVNMGGVDATITIPSLSVIQNDGTAIKAQPAGSVNASISRGQTGTDASSRWLIGEDSTAFAGAIRDMWNPTCYSNPGKVSDTLYFCGTGDGGGVHFNSGVPNHAYALLVDGGTYNGHTVNAIGLTKAAHIYYRAMTVYQHSASDFADHADAIETSASDLIGVPLTSVTGGADETISASDVSQVEKAMLAVEMRTPPAQCGFQPLLAQNPPALCDGGNATQLFHDTFNNASHWTMSHEAVTPADFTERDWVLSADLPDNREGQGLFGIDPDLGTCAPGGDESGVLHAVSKKISIPASVSKPMLTFVHWVATEAGWDGGNLKISVNDGPWQLIQAADFVYNPYNTTLVTAAGGNTNPMAGEPAFSGTDGGSVDGSWGRSIVNLAPYAKPKDKIQLRFDIGNDGCTGLFGWYIDDVMVYRCHN